MNFIEYVKQIWKNGPSGGTPWSAARLNHMEDGIANNNSMISELNNNILKFYKIALPPNKKLRIHINTGSPFYGFVVMQGIQGSACSCSYLNGYGIGGNARYHITHIIKATDKIVFTYGENETQDFLITNNIINAEYNLSVFVYMSCAIFLEIIDI